ncbi:MAG: hypothetical protein ACRDHZ_20580, partial [Ktedonobacteraceae bacterium]
HSLGQSAQKIVDAARSNHPQQVINDLPGTAKDPQVCRMDALNSCQRVSALLRNTSPQDAAEYKQFVLNCAQKVAEAGKDGSILSMGGSRVSPNEQNLLKDIAQALEIPQA